MMVSRYRGIVVFPHLCISALFTRYPTVDTSLLCIARLSSLPLLRIKRLQLARVTLLPSHHPILIPPHPRPTHSPPSLPPSTIGTMHTTMFTMYTPRPLLHSHPSSLIMPTIIVLQYYYSMSTTVPSDPAHRTPPPQNEIHQGQPCLPPRSGSACTRIHSTVSI